MYVFMSFRQAAIQKLLIAGVTLLLGLTSLMAGAVECADPRKMDYMDSVLTAADKISMPKADVLKAFDAGAITERGLLAWQKRSLPTGSVGGKPTGVRAGPLNGSRENKRSLTRGNEAADLLANAGYRVEQLAKNIDPVTGLELKSPDYKIEGVLSDCYAPGGATSAKNIQKTIQNKVKDQNAKTIVLNITDLETPLNSVLDLIRRNGRPSRLEELIVIGKDGLITSYFPF